MNKNRQATTTLSQESLQKIDREVAKYPADQKQSAVMAALGSPRTRRAGCPRNHRRRRRYLGMAPIAAFEVASFYNMYDLHPVGKYKITVCTNLPCALSGGVHAADYVKEKLGIDFNETTPTASSR
jgi:NADH-quinone oxidoreductase subunit E